VLNLKLIFKKLNISSYFVPVVVDVFAAGVLVVPVVEADVLVDLGAVELVAVSEAPVIGAIVADAVGAAFLTDAGAEAVPDVSDVGDKEESVAEGSPTLGSYGAILTGVGLQAKNKLRIINNIFVISTD